MATLPDTLGTFEVTQEPGLTWYIDQSAGRIQGTCDGYKAVRQAVEIILNTERFKWQIYEPSSGVAYAGLLGQEAGYVAIELQRQLKEALMMDDRVLGISGFEYTAEDGILRASFTVDTVFGALAEQAEVPTR